MNSQATSPTPSKPPSESATIVRAALEQLLQMGLTVAGVSARLAKQEERALEVLGEATEAAARGIVAAPDSIVAAMEAGRVADASDGARATIVARMVTITATFDVASRAVRRTAALIRRMEQPYRAAPAELGEAERVRRAAMRAAAAAAAPRDADEETVERLPDDLDTAERDDEIGGRPIVAVIRDICRDLGVRLTPGAESVMPAAVLVSAPEAPRKRSDRTPRRVACWPPREPET